MILLQEARALIQEKVGNLPAERCGLREASGRVLREDVVAAEDMPAFDRSSMDGYAVAMDDLSGRFRVVAEIQPGHAPAVELRSGECARIFTGAMIPRGASQVIMQEDVQREGDWMIPVRRDRDANVRHRGEDARAGMVLLRAGTRLGVGELAMLAQCGAVTPLVGAVPRVLHIATGEEIVSPEQTPAAGQLRDSNSTLIAALVAQAGAALHHQTRCGDDAAHLRGAIESVPAGWEVLLISGGASVGDYDFGKRVLGELGFTIHFAAVNLRPGKPLVFATRGEQVAFVIPGNPVSHFVTFHVAIRSALDRLQGAPASWTVAALPIASGMPAQKGRETWWPARLEFVGGALRVQPLAWQSSGDVGGMLGADALLQIVPPAGPFSRGALLPCLILR